MTITTIEDKKITWFQSDSTRETSFILEEEADYIHLYQDRDMIGIPKCALKDFIKCLKETIKEKK